MSSHHLEYEQMLILIINNEQVFASADVPNAAHDRICWYFCSISLMFEAVGNWPHSTDPRGRRSLCRRI
jgi:hypothetical protein